MFDNEEEYYVTGEFAGGDYLTGDLREGFNKKSFGYLDAFAVIFVAVYACSLAEHYFGSVKSHEIVEHVQDGMQRAKENPVTKLPDPNPFAFRG